ncbi:RNA-directed DNA polymerase, eukaryota, reverse transcriptase zinc-binding domain protein [Tanacetum coccineum]
MVITSSLNSLSDVNLPSLPLLSLVADSLLRSVEDDKVDQAAMKIGCVTLKAPFSYLGSKVGVSMSRIQSWNEIIDRVVARLSNWKIKTLSIGGRLMLIKSVLGSLPIYSKKPIWVKWKSILASKEKGGLGVSSLYALNRALMFKWVWRFFNQGSSLWARVIKAIHGVDGKIAGNRDNTCFWEEIWCGDIELKKLYPRLFSLETNKNVTIASKLSHSSLVSSFRQDPRGGAEQSQLDALMDKLQDVSLVNMRDRWVWSLEGSRDFFVASVRKLVDDNTLPEISAKSRWVKVVPIKVNIHAWKVRLLRKPKDMDRLMELKSFSNTGFTQKASMQRMAKDDSDAQDACQSFENYLLKMIGEAGNIRDLVDVEELLNCWKNLKDPLFMNLVCRFYGELCKDLFSSHHVDNDGEDI